MCIGGSPRASGRMTPASQSLIAGVKPELGDTIVSSETFLGGDPVGALLFITAVSLPIAVILSLLILHLYQRAVARLMQSTAAARTTAGPAVAAEPVRATLPAEPPPFALQVMDEDAAPLVSDEARRRLAQTRHSALRAAAIYAVAGAAHALVATIVLFASSDTEFLPLRTSFVWFILAWPIVPTVFFVAVGSRRIRGIGIAAYFFVALAISPVSWIELATLWGTFMGVPTLLLIAVGHRRLRAVGPLVLVATFLVVIGANLALTAAFNAGFVLAAAVVAAFIALAWWTVQWIAERYRRKRMSDLGLTLDAWWLLFTLWECLDFSAAEGLGGAFVLAAFAVYKLVLALGFRLISPSEPRSVLSLLLLRVFGFRKRSERLLDELGHKWRYAGPVNLISAPDLATGYVEPHEFLDYLAGRLSRTFVKSASDLETRLTTLDRTPDPDGRYRVNEFFCHADTWQPTMRRLAQKSDAILMDLRSFSRDNRGCAYELRELLDGVPVDRIVLVIDATTDRALLEAMLRDMWRTLAPTSPNLAPQQRALRIFLIKSRSSRAIDKLLLALFVSDAQQSPEVSGTAVAEPFTC